MTTALIISLISLGAAYGAVTWWSLRKISDLGGQVVGAMKEEATAKLEKATTVTRLERAEFERDAAKSALSTAQARIKSLEEALHDVLSISAGDGVGASLRADDAAARVRQRIAKYRADHPDAGGAGSALPASAGPAAVSGVGAAGVAAPARDLPR